MLKKSLIIKRPAKQLVKEERAAFGDDKKWWKDVTGEWKEFLIDYKLSQENDKQEDLSLCLIVELLQ